MRAAVFTAVNEPLSVEDVTPLDPGPSDVVVKVGASGVCHSDLSISPGLRRRRRADGARPRGDRRGRIGRVGRDPCQGR